MSEFGFLLFDVLDIDATTVVVDRKVFLKKQSFSIFLTIALRNMEDYEEERYFDEAERASFAKVLSSFKFYRRV